MEENLTKDQVVRLAWSLGAMSNDMKVYEESEMVPLEVKQLMRQSRSCVDAAVEKFEKLLGKIALREMEAVR